MPDNESLTKSSQDLFQIPEIQKQIKEMAKKYWAALASGSSVLISENGNLVEIFPNGKQKCIKHLPPSIPVIRGQKLEIL